MPFSRDKNGRVYVARDRVTRMGVGCFGFVAEDEGTANMLRDNPVEPEWGRRRAGAEIMVSRDKGQENTGPEPSPCADDGVKVPTANDPAMY